jgi:hypothetical protein
MQIKPRPALDYSANRGFSFPSPRSSQSSPLASEAFAMSARVKPFSIIRREDNTQNQISSAPRRVSFLLIQSCFIIRHGKKRLKRRKV